MIGIGAVGPRDGLHSGEASLPVEQRLELVRRPADVRRPTVETVRKVSNCMQDRTFGWLVGGRTVPRER
jgi:hypothetical protein